MEQRDSSDTAAVQWNGNAIWRRLADWLGRGAVQCLCAPKWSANPLTSKNASDQTTSVQNKRAALTCTLRQAASLFGLSASMQIGNKLGA